MKLSYEKKIWLPKLSWCCEISKCGGVVSVICGESVECRDNFFCAGVWDGSFDEGDFANAHFACCSGAKIQGGGLDVLYA